VDKRQFGNCAITVFFHRGVTGFSRIFHYPKPASHNAERQVAAHQNRISSRDIPYRNTKLIIQAIDFKQNNNFKNR
jgi:hypothetical protein